MSVLALVQFARANSRTRVLIGKDGPMLLHPWWERGLREQLRVLAAAKPPKKTEQEKSNAS